MKKLKTRSKRKTKTVHNNKTKRVTIPEHWIEFLNLDPRKKDNVEIEIAEDLNNNYYFLMKKIQDD